MCVVRSLVTVGLLLFAVGDVGAQNAAADSAATLVEKENIVEMRTQRGPWKDAPPQATLRIGDGLRTGEYSRAAVQFTDLSMLRVDELTTLEISAPAGAGGARQLGVERGGTYFFSRDKSQEIEIRTPVANGALRGTEFELRVGANGRTRVTMFDGAVELSNRYGRVTIGSGEQAVVDPGRAPRKTAVIEAHNIIQWCLYYPAVLDPEELGFTAGSKSLLAPALAAYRSGNLPAALNAHRFATAAPSPGEKLLRAMLTLSVGQVDKAAAGLRGVAASDPGRRALERLIAAVTLQSPGDLPPPVTSSEWLAESYLRQAHQDLTGALTAARTATEKSPQFGYAWARLAELEFSFGRTPRASQLLERGLELSPQNAQAHALQGFLLSAENRIGAARRSFETAIALDGALGNAWLGRGLTFIRQNREDEGRRDLQIAAVLEPNRSILRSYLGKAFSQAGRNDKANLELARAQELDPRDPTPWLYSALQRKQENRYNEAIADLEKSVDLNDNRRLYRSEFLLDQDRAVRGINLAAIYRNNGMIEQSVREAVRAVNRDYTSAGAHLFLSNSYDALRDPNQILARYETTWLNELLLSQLLAPVGGGSLSQFVSQQEYSKLFEQDRPHVSSLTEYRSDGRLLQRGSLFGTVGALGYAIDGSYRWDNGIRPNSEFSQWNTTATFKLQLRPSDTIFFQAAMQQIDSGDVFQRYDNRNTGSIFRDVTEKDGRTRRRRFPDPEVLSFHFGERQDPGTLLAGWQHEWSPGNQTLLLLGRLANRQMLTQQKTTFPTVFRDVSLIAPPSFAEYVDAQQWPKDPAIRKAIRALAGQGTITNTGEIGFDLDYRANFETYSVDLQQVLTVGPTSSVIGTRYQQGEFETRVSFGNFAAGRRPGEEFTFGGLPVRQAATVDLERFSIYAYETLHVARWLSIIGGITYDHLDRPDNFRYPPINARGVTDNEFLPKAGFILEPWRGAVLRGAYSRTLSGASFEESVRLEPTQVAGFVQSTRSFAPESVIGPTSGSRFETFNASFEQRFSSFTYLGFQYDYSRQNLDRTIGVFDTLFFDRQLARLPSSQAERGHYTERTYTATVNQALGQGWSLGARYTMTNSQLDQHLPKLAGAANLQSTEDQVGSLAKSRLPRREANLHGVSLFAVFNSSTGFFCRGEGNWFHQDSDEFQFYIPPTEGPAAPLTRLRKINAGLPGDDFWQVNIFAGYRFYRNQCEFSIGGLNLGGRDYQLNPLNPYQELPRDRTVLVQCKLNF